MKYLNLVCFSLFFLFFSVRAESISKKTSLIFEPFYAQADDGELINVHDESALELTVYGKPSSIGQVQPISDLFIYHNGNHNQKIKISNIYANTSPYFLFDEKGEAKIRLGAKRNSVHWNMPYGEYQGTGSLKVLDEDNEEQEYSFAVEGRVVYPLVITENSMLEFYGTAGANGRLSPTKEASFIVTGEPNQRVEAKILDSQVMLYKSNHNGDPRQAYIYVIKPRIIPSTIVLDHTGYALIQVVGLANVRVHNPVGVYTGTTSLDVRYPFSSRRLGASDSFSIGVLLK